MDLIKSVIILVIRPSHKLPIKVSKWCQKVAEKLPKFFCFSSFFWVLKIKNSHIASYQNFICQSPMIISEVLSISLDQQIVYQNDMNRTWLYTDSSELDVLESL